MPLSKPQSAEPAPLKEGTPTAGDRKTLAYLLHDLEGVGTTVQAFTVCGAMVERGYRVDLVVVKRIGALSECIPKNVGVVELLRDSRLVPQPFSYFCMRGRPRVSRRSGADSCVSDLVASLSAKVPTSVWQVQPKQVNLFVERAARKNRLCVL